MAERYVISLPEFIPESYFSRVDNGNNAIYKSLSDFYSQLSKKVSTSASSPKDALGHLFFRGGQEITSKTLLKIFKPNADKYAFEVPELDWKNYDIHDAKTFQKMELGMNIAEARGREESDRACQDLARELLKTL